MQKAEKSQRFCMRQHTDGSEEYNVHGSEDYSDGSEEYTVRAWL